MAETRSTPRVNSFSQISQLATKKVKSQGKKRLALVSSGAGRGYEAIARAVEMGLINPIVIAAKKDAQQVQEQYSRTSFETVTAPDLPGAVAMAFQMAQQGKVNMILVDEYAADAAVEAIRRDESGFVGRGAAVSCVAVLKPEKYPKFLLLSDSMIITAPDLKAKIGIIQNIVVVAGALTMVKPRIAVLAAVEVVYPQMPVTIEGAVLAKMAERGQIKGAFVDGPLSFDVAMDEFAATSKGITQSEVAGQADAFLAPNIEVASGVYSALALYGSCERGAVVVGGTVPVVIAARTDRGEELLNSIFLGVLSA